MRSGSCVGRRRPVDRPFVVVAIEDRDPLLAGSLQTTRRGRVVEGALGEDAMKLEDRLGVSVSPISSRMNCSAR